jgi:hypothetical protein
MQNEEVEEIANVLFKKYLKLDLKGISSAGFDDLSAIKQLAIIRKLFGSKV